MRKCIRGRMRTKCLPVIRLLAYRHIPQQSRALSRQEYLVARDGIRAVLRTGIPSSD